MRIAGKITEVLRGPIFRPKAPELRPAITTIGRFQVVAKSFALSGRSLKEFGINPKVFKGSIEVWLLDPLSVKKLCQERGLDENRFQGLYSMPIDNGIPQVMRGDVDRLPQGERQIAVPEKFARDTLTHELLHDVFLGSFGRDERGQFYRCVAGWFMKTSKNASRLKENRFFIEVNKLTAVPYPLEDVTGEKIARSLNENSFSDHFRLFADECFAYAGQLLISGDRGEEGMGLVPREMKEYFLRKGIIIPPKEPKNTGLRPVSPERLGKRRNSP